MEQQGGRRRGRIRLGAPSTSRAALAAACLAACLAAAGCSDDSPSDIEQLCEPGDAPVPAVSGGAPVAIVGVTVLPMGGFGALEDHTVVIVGDRITAVGPAAQVQVPPGAVQVDGTCRFVMPGLLDMHVHLNYFEDLLLYVANGITTLREMWGSPGRLALRNAVRDGSFDRISPWIIQASPGIDGAPPIFPGSRFSTNDPDEAAGFVDIAAGEGWDFIKVYEQLLPGVYDRILRRADELGLIVAGHVPHRTGPIPVVASNQVSIEHLDDYYMLLPPSGQASTWWHGPIDPARTPGVASQVAADGVMNVPTLSVTAALRTEADRAAFDANTPELRYLPPSVLELWDRQGNYGQEPSQRDAALRQQKEFLAALVAANANVMVGTDAGFSRILPGFAIHEEMAHMADAGLSPESILEMATSVPAAFLALGNEIGSVRVGLRADLLVLDGDPRRDLGHLKRRAGVVLRGEWMSESHLLGRLEAQADSIATGASSQTRLEPLELAHGR